MFLRKEGHASEAIEVLDAAQVVMGEARPEWRILQELGLAHAAAGNEERGVELLERVVQMFSAQRLTDLPHDTAVPLAELHEKLGNKVRAADLYASLAKGTDRERLHAYNLNAARLLIELGQRDDAMRLLQQATELANTPEERQAAEALASSV
jgi:tetratricopeptide (TPR) repeat protein